MPTDTAIVGTSPCILEPRPHIWDLGGTMTVTFADESDPDEPVGFIDSNQVLLVTVTVTLTGRIRYYLCDTTLCVCLAFNACGPGSTGEYCERIVLEGPNSPCRTDKWVFKIRGARGHVHPGRVRAGVRTLHHPGLQGLLRQGRLRLRQLPRVHHHRVAARDGRRRNPPARGRAVSRRPRLLSGKSLHINPGGPANPVSRP